MFITFLYFVTVLVCVVLIMGDSEIIKIKGKNKHLTKLILGGVFLLIIFYIVMSYVGSVGHPFNVDGEGDKRAALGALGDYFGGLLNPILAFLSFIALLWTLKLNQEELAETRKELARAATAQEESQRLMDSQCETQKIQQFDSLFTVLISQLSKKIEEVEPSLNKVGSFSMTLYEVGHLDIERRQKIIRDPEISSLFIFLYQILKYIKESFDDADIRKRYSNIVRSLMPDKVLQIVIINCYLNTTEHNFDKYKKLLEDFSFFEHMTLYFSNIEKTIILLRFVAYYNPSVFGQHQGYRDFRNSLVFQSKIFEEDFQNSFCVREVIKKIVLASQHTEDNTDVERLALIVSIPSSTAGFIIKVLKDISPNKFSGIQINDQWVTNFYFKENKIIFSVDDSKFESVVAIENGRLKFITA